MKEIARVKDIITRLCNDIVFAYDNYSDTTFNAMKDELECQVNYYNTLGYYHKAIIIKPENSDIPVVSFIYDRFRKD